MKKAIFIIHKSSEERLRECIASINAQKKPLQYRIGIVAYSDNDGCASDIYMTIQQKEKADITIILDDTVLLVNESLVKDIDRIFLSEPSVRLVGIKGTESMPGNGNIDDAANVYGGMYETNAVGDVFERKYHDCPSDYVQVEAISSTLVAVKGYIPIWSGIKNTSIGEIFSVAAAIQGYKAVVSRNSYNWCYSTVPELSGTADEIKYIQQKYEFKRSLFTKDHYLLSIGIPTFNRVKYFGKCLANIYRIVGDMPWIEVFVSNNDSTDNTEEIAVQYLHHKNFRYYKQPVNIRGKNFDYLYEHARGDFVVACGDDDYYRPEGILDLLETICLYPDTTVIELGWSSRDDFPTRLNGNGLDDFLVNCTNLYTCISSIVLNHKEYLAVKVKDRFTHTHLNQCYIQLEMLRNAGKFIILTNNCFLTDSGEAAKGRIFPREKRSPFCDIFVREYYPILDYFLDNGLSKVAYEKEKLINLNKILMWLRYIKQAGDTTQWLIDEDLEDLIEEFYGYEPYYEELKKEVAMLLDKN